MKEEKAFYSPAVSIYPVTNRKLRMSSTVQVVSANISTSSGKGTQSTDLLTDKELGSICSVGYLYNLINT